MKQLTSFVTNNHTSTKRDYVGRVLEASKAECATIAKKWGKDYWDGERKYGYGGYKYDGRWAPIAEKIATHYQLAANAKILDVGCGKAFLLHDLKEHLPQSQVTGIDVSSYGIENAQEAIRDSLKIGNANKLEFDDNEFDLVISINTLHNLPIFDLFTALREMQRVTRKDAYLCVESYRNENEKVNLLYWQLTCESFYSDEEWNWIFKESGYAGDYEFIYFE